MNNRIILLLLCICPLIGCGQQFKKRVSEAKATRQSTDARSLSASIDSLLDAPTEKPFNGVVVVARNGSIQYARAKGYSDQESRKALKLTNRFVVGSVSKQFTSVLMLRAYEQGQVALDVPIRKYLPELKASWADTVTIHHLLTHTSGIEEQNPSGPLKFKPGSKFEYNQQGYFLMSVILMRLNGKPFGALADSMFHQCGMMNTYCPGFHSDSSLVNGYEEQGGKTRRVARKETFEMNLMEGEIPEGQQISNMLIPAGGFVSTAEDLVRWNEALHHGKLLTKKAYEMMVTKQPNAIRDHPLFGKVAYGYGLTIDTDGPLQLGQTGRLPGFASMDYYFPETGISVVVLDNMPYYAGDLKKNFQYHLQILKMVRAAQ